MSVEVEIKLHKGAAAYDQEKKLSKTVAAKIRPQYKNWLKRSGASEAYTHAYDEVVKLVA